MNSKRYRCRGYNLITGYTQGDFTRVIAYEPSHDLIAAVENRFNTTTISSFDYQNNAAGQRTRRIDNGVTTNNFGYNIRQEVTSATMGADNYGYGYDTIGNREWASLNLVTNLYAANNLNQYTTISAPVREPLYDLDGNMIYDGYKYYYTYDAENRMKSVSSNGIIVASYVYDYGSRRIREENATATYHFIWDDWNTIAETISTTQATHTNFYTWGLDLSDTLQGAGGVGGLLGASFNGQNALYTYSANGDVDQLVSPFSGTTLARYQYDPFGNILIAEGSLAKANPFRFSTKHFSNITNLGYWGYRWYNPFDGRWLNPDPIGKRGGLSLYGFVENDGVNKWDYLGMSLSSWLSTRREQKITGHYQQLKEKLKNELKAMCPQKATRWKTGSRYKPGGLCCEPEACKETAEAMADAYVTTLEAAYRARKIPGWWFGNVCVCIINLVTNESNKSFGQTYTVAETPYLTCSGWEHMASKVLSDDFKLVNDSCWSYTKKYKLAPKVNKNGDQGGHTWGILQVMDGAPKVIDPWKSGGYAY